MVPQAFYVAIAYNDYLSFLVLVITLTAMFGYVVSYYLGSRLSFARDLSVSKGRMKVFYIVLYFYLFSYLALYVHYGGIPIIDVLINGESAPTARAMFYKEVDGLFNIFVYLRSILTRGFLPFAIIILFVTKPRKSFYIYLFLFSALSVSALEKSLLLWFYGPFIVFCLMNGYKKELYFSLLSVFLFFCLVTAVSFGSADSASFASGNDIYRSCQECESSKEVGGYGFRHANQKIDIGNNNFSTVSLKDQDNHQFLMHSTAHGGAVTYILNRIFWIPYVTVYDTLGYWHERYDGFILFGVNRHLSALFGYEFADLEREVFRYQYGSGYSSTGNANSAFFAEAYIGFGIFGVVLFSSIIGWFSGVVGKSNIYPFACSLPFIVKGLISVSLISMLFSGGLFFYMLFYLYFTKRLRV